MKAKDLLASLRKGMPESEVVCLVSRDDRVIRINSVDPKGADGNVVLAIQFPRVSVSHGVANDEIHMAILSVFPIA